MKVTEVGPSFEKIYFFDTSAIVKRYKQEIGTDRVDAIFHSKAGIAISNITIAEFASAIRISVNLKEMTEEQMFIALDRFLFDVDHKFLKREISSNHLGDAFSLIVKYGLRPGDAIELATALEGKKTYIFVCSDHDLLEAAHNEGLEVLNPEA